MGNSCGCLDFGGGNSCIWIILILLLCGGGCGCDNGGFLGGLGGDNSCIWIILILLFCCGGGSFGMCEAK